MKIPFLENALQKRFEKKATAAFSAALDEIPKEVDRNNLSGAVKHMALRDVPVNFTFDAEGREFTLSCSATRAQQERQTYLPGTVLIHTVNPGFRGQRIELPFWDSTLYPEAKKWTSITFGPCVENRFRALARNITAFSHVVLNFKDRKAVLLITVLQKSTSERISKRVQDRPVDAFVGKYGPDRHLVFLHVAEQIAAAMKAKGIETEVHVPVPEAFAPGAVDLATRKRIRRPFARLAGHFERDSLRFHGQELPTINLSRPKRA
ncbi:MAG: hypothetical protein V1722_01355 [Candidatus Micrarchaeota archaeon]